ncbi:hypothetical protein PCE1_001450 [Barthelona sp. PCE]
MTTSVLTKILQENASLRLKLRRMELEDARDKDLPPSSAIFLTEDEHKECLEALSTENTRLTALNEHLTSSLRRSDVQIQDLQKEVSFLEQGISKTVREAVQATTNKFQNQLSTIENSSDDRMQGLNSKNTELRGQISSLMDKLKGAHSTLVELTRKNDALKNQKEQLTISVKELSIEVDKNSLDVQHFRDLETLSEKTIGELKEKNTLIIDLIDRINELEIGGGGTQPRRTNSLFNESEKVKSHLSSDVLTRLKKETNEAIISDDAKNSLELIRSASFTKKTPARDSRRSARGSRRSTRGSRMNSGRPQVSSISARVDVIEEASECAEDNLSEYDDYDNESDSDIDFLDNVVVAGKTAREYYSEVVEEPNIVDMGVQTDLPFFLATAGGSEGSEAVPVPVFQVESIPNEISTPIIENHSVVDTVPVVGEPAMNESPIRSKLDSPVFCIVGEYRGGQMQQFEPIMVASPSPIAPAVAPFVAPAFSNTQEPIAPPTDQPTNGSPYRRRRDSITSQYSQYSRVSIFNDSGSQLENLARKSGKLLASHLIEDEGIDPKDAPDYKELLQRANKLGKRVELYKKKLDHVTLNLRAKQIEFLETDEALQKARLDVGKLRKKVYELERDEPSEENKVVFEDYIGLQRTVASLRKKLASIVQRCRCGSVQQVLPQSVLQGILEESEKMKPEHHVVQPSPQIEISQQDNPGFPPRLSKLHKLREYRDAHEH